MAKAKNKSFLTPGTFGKLNGSYNNPFIANSKKNSLQKWIKMASPNPLGSVGKHKPKKVF